MNEREAKADIGEVLVRYATCIDRRDWDLFRTCFTHDVHADYGRIGTWDGIDALTEAMREMHADMGDTLHRISNIAVEIDGDTAHSRAYVDAVLKAPEDVVLNGMGYYDDRFVRTGSEWRIAERRFTMVHFRKLRPGA